MSHHSINSLLRGKRTKTRALLAACLCALVIFNFTRAFAQQPPSNVFAEQVALWWIFVPTILLAGLSEAVGQSFVLFINRVRPSRFIPSILLSTILFLFGYFETVFVIWFTARYILGYTNIILPIMYAVGVSYVPLIFSFLTLLPYLGPGIVRILYLLSYTIMVRTLNEVTGFPVPEAVGTLLIALIVLYVVRGTIGRPLEALTRGIRNRIAGTQLERNIDKAIDTIDAQLSDKGAK